MGNHPLYDAAISGSEPVRSWRFHPQIEVNVVADGRPAVSLPDGPANLKTQRVPFSATEDED